MLFKSAWIPAPPEGSEPAMERTRGTGRPGRGGAAGNIAEVAVGITRVVDKRHPFAGASRTGSTGVNLSRLSARHPVSVPQPSFFAWHRPKVTHCDRAPCLEMPHCRCIAGLTHEDARPATVVAGRAFTCRWRLELRGRNPDAQDDGRLGRLRGAGIAVNGAAGTGRLRGLRLVGMPRAG